MKFEEALKLMRDGKQCKDYLDRTHAIVFYHEIIGCETNSWEELHSGSGKDHSETVLSSKSIMSEWTLKEDNTCN